MIRVQIVNEEGEVVVYLNLADEDSFYSLTNFINGLGYKVEEMGS
jgi:hypothetical protein